MSRGTARPPVSRLSSPGRGFSPGWAPSTTSATKRLPPLETRRSREWLTSSRGDSGEGPAQEKWRLAVRPWRLGMFRFRRRSAVPLRRAEPFWVRWGHGRRQQRDARLMSGSHKASPLITNKHNTQADRQAPTVSSFARDWRRGHSLACYRGRINKYTNPRMPVCDEDQPEGGAEGLAPTWRHRTGQVGRFQSGRGWVISDGLRAGVSRCVGASPITRPPGPLWQPRVPRPRPLSVQRVWSPAMELRILWAAALD